MILYNWLGGIHNQTTIIDTWLFMYCNFDYKNIKNPFRHYTWFLSSQEDKGIKYICFLITCSCIVTIVSDMSCVELPTTRHQPERFHETNNSIIFGFPKILISRDDASWAFVYLLFLFSTAFILKLKYFQMNFIPFFFRKFSCCKEQQTASKQTSKIQPHRSPSCFDMKV